MLTALDHAVIAVRDLDAATETYAGLFGRRPSWRGEHPELGTANALFRLRNTYVELLSPAAGDGFGRELGERLERGGEGVFALAFGTDDAERCAKWLRERGLDAADPASGHGRDRDTGAERRWRHVRLPASDTRGVFLFVIEHLSDGDALPPAEPVETESSAVAGVDHVVVGSRDLEATRALYGDQLGIRLALDRSFPERGSRLLFFRLAGITVEIAGRMGAAADPGAPDRLGGIAYQVPDVPAARARVAAAGFDVSEVRTGRKPGTAVCTVRGPTCGVPTLLIGPDSR